MNLEKNKYDCQTRNTKGIIDVKKTNMALKCKIFDTVNLTLYGHYTHVFTLSKFLGINTENKICQLNKEYISGH